MFPSHQCQKWGIALQSWYPLTTVSLVAAGVLTNLSTVALSNNQLTGPLPESWGENGNLPGLQSLDVSANNLSGPLPSVWGHNNSFMLLTNLNLANNTLSGGLPAAWANLGRFPRSATARSAVQSAVRCGRQSCNVSPMSAVLHALGVLRRRCWSAPRAAPHRYAALPAAISWAWHCAFTGNFPPSWGQANHLPKLNALTLAPGNDGLCGSLPTVSYAIKYSSASGLSTTVAPQLGACICARCR